MPQASVFKHDKQVSNLQSISPTAGHYGYVAQLNLPTMDGGWTTMVLRDFCNELADVKKRIGLQEIAGNVRLNMVAGAPIDFDIYLVGIEKDATFTNTSIGDTDYTIRELIEGAAGSNVVQEIERIGGGKAQIGWTSDSSYSNKSVGSFKKQFSKADQKEGGPCCSDEHKSSLEIPKDYILVIVLWPGGASNTFPTVTVYCNTAVEWKVKAARLTGAL